MSTPINTVITGDAAEEMARLKEASISACITDPPYNYEFIGHRWDTDEVNRRIRAVAGTSKTLVKNIPYGSGLAGGVRNANWYERVRRNAHEYREWTQDWGREAFRVLKPGSYLAIFNSTRTIGQVQVALEDAGFYSRDILVYRRPSGIPRGLNLAGRREKQGLPVGPEHQGQHSALRNEWEAIALLQKPLVDNYLKTYERFGTGLMKAVGPDGRFQSNVLEGYRLTSEDKAVSHPTRKPVALMRKLVDLLVPFGEHHVVLDPFAGSGSTLIAAKREGRPFIGIEMDPEYANMSRRRVGITSV